MPAALAPPVVPELVARMAVMGVSRRALALATGVSATVVTAVIYGRTTPTAAFQAATGRLLDADPDELFSADADEVARRRIAKEVRAARVAQGLPPEPTDEQMDLIGTIVASGHRRRSGADNHRRNIPHNV